MSSTTEAALQAGSLEQVYWRTVGRPLLRGVEILAGVMLAIDLALTQVLWVRKSIGRFPVSSV